MTQARLTVVQVGQSRKASVKPGSNPKASYGSKQDDMVIRADGVERMTLQRAVNERTKIKIKENV
jgi:hypothetical protein